MMDRKRRKSAAIRSALRFLIAGVMGSICALAASGRAQPARSEPPQAGIGADQAQTQDQNKAPEQREAVKGDAGHRSPDDELDALFREFALERESRMKRFQDAIKGKKAVPAAKKDNEYVDRIVRRALEHASTRPASPVRYGGKGVDLPRRRDPIQARLGPRGTSQSRFGSAGRNGRTRATGKATRTRHANQGRAERSISALAEQDDDECLADDFKVEGVRPVFDIIHVELNHSLITQFAPPADLPRAGEARHDVETTRISLGIEGQELITIAKL